jgi:cyclophilin family peptidyl-prolyl cis-trans isomerase
MGVVSTSNSKPNENTGDFFIQLSEHHLQHLNNKHTVFGQVVEGIEIL